MAVGANALSRTAIGALAGIFGGILFVMAEMAISSAAGLSALDPLRVIGSIVLGPQALSAGVPLFSAALIGLALHFLLSAGYGAVFTGGLGAVLRAEVPNSVFLVMGIAYAMLLWTINFLIASPILFPQVTVNSLLWLEFGFAHVLYGLGLGTYLAISSQNAETREGA